jgi:polyisoprenoid-binding protein YceI
MRKHAVVVGLALACLAVNAAQSTAKTITFVVGDSEKRDSVSFNSDAPVEVIVGNTSSIRGQVVVDETLDLSKMPISATFEVPLSTIDTGIDLRNQHMRDNFLETAKYPNAIFKLTKIQPAVLKPNQKVTVKADGEFSLHGVTVKKTIPIDIFYAKKCESQQKMEGCDLLQIKAKFSVPLDDHKIKRPEAVFQKLASTVYVTIAATAFYKPTK